MAAGGVALEKLFVASRRHWVAATYAALLIVVGILTIPFGVPLLPVDTFLKYSNFFPYSHSVKTERDSTTQLPQVYADMFGWQNMAEQIARVYHDLPQEEQPGCAILAGNYGEAGAIDHYGAKLGLPKAISGHNSYYDWGPRSYTGSCVILFGERADKYKAPYFDESHLVATIIDPHVALAERNVQVYVCRKPIAPLAVLWPHFRIDNLSVSAASGVAAQCNGECRGFRAACSNQPRSIPTQPTDVQSPNPCAGRSQAKRIRT